MSQTSPCYIKTSYLIISVTVPWDRRFTPGDMYFYNPSCQAVVLVNDEVRPLWATVLPVSHITASLSPYNELTWKTVHENVSLWFLVSLGPLKLHILGPARSEELEFFWD